jgi:hypothetical protein
MRCEFSKRNQQRDRRGDEVGDAGLSGCRLWWRKREGDEAVGEEVGLLKACTTEK